VIFCRSKNRQTALRLPAIPCWRMATTISSKVKSGCLAASASKQASCAFNGDVLPPIGCGAALPNRTNLAPTGFAELTSKRSVASCRGIRLYEAPMAKISAHEHGHNGIHPSISAARVACAAWLL
jgi:hypothetical protein